MFEGYFNYGGVNAMGFVWDKENKKKLDSILFDEETSLTIINYLRLKIKEFEDNNLCFYLERGKEWLSPMTKTTELLNVFEKKRSVYNLINVIISYLSLSEDDEIILTRDGPNTNRIVQELVDEGIDESLVMFVTDYFKKQGISRRRDEEEWEEEKQPMN